MKTKHDNEYERIANAVRDTDAYKSERVKADFTERIWNRLDELGLSQADFARRLKVTPARITKILDGTANITFNTAVAISSALDMDFEAALVPKNGIPANCGRIAVGFIEGALQAKVNSSWRNATFAPANHLGTNRGNSSNEYAATATA